MSSLSQVAGDPSAVEYNMEFRSYNDDAWYTVQVVLEGEVLRIKFQGFSDEQDSEFDVKEFDSLEQLSEFQNRFRQLSDQLQDNECDTIVRGMTVCALLSFDDYNARFYDAKVDGVEHQEHTFEKGEEVCLCNFLLFWLHGPNAGKTSTTGIGDICKVRHAMDLDPAVTSFLKMARNRIEVTSSSSSFISKRAIGREVVQYPNESPNTHCRLDLLEGLHKENQYAKCSDTNTCPSKELVSSVNHRKRLEDSDLGGIEYPYMILLGNLDKELSSPAIAEFLHEQTSVLPGVYIYPNMPWETYTTAAIVLDSEYNFEKLRGFLRDPKCIIISSTGRPLVVIKEVVGFEDIKAAIGTLPVCKNVYPKESSGKSNDLKVVYSGTEDFEMACRLKKLFVGFSDHQVRLHGRLALEENLIRWRC